jgi:hypothetical protein
MSDQTIWLQSGELDGVTQSELERLAESEGARLVRALAKGERASVVLGEKAPKAKHETTVCFLTGAELRRRYGLGLSVDERVAAIRDRLPRSAPSYRRFATASALVIGAIAEHERERAVRAAIDALSDVDPEERYVPVAAIDAAMQGRSAIAHLGSALTLRADQPEDLARARWLGEDPTRLDNLSTIYLHGNSLEGSLEVLRALGTREIALLKLPRLSSKDLCYLVEALPSTVRGISAFYAQAGDMLFAAITRSQAWPTLVRLNLHNNEGKSAGLESLLAAQQPTSIEALDIGYNHLKSEDFGKLAKAPWLSQLRSLSLKYNDAKAKGAEALFSNGDFSTLEALDFGANEIGDEGVDAIVGNRTIRSLSSLTIEGNHTDPLLSEKSARAIAQWPGARGIRSLNLAQNRVGDEGFVAIVSSPHLGSVQTLDLQYNAISMKALEQLSGVETAMRPRVVILSGNALGNGAYGDEPRAPSPTQSVGVWRDARWLAECERLVLYNTSLDPDLLAALLQSNALPKLRALDLSSNDGLGNDMLEYLVRSPMAPQLTELEILYWNWKKGAAALLLDTPLADRLESLSMSSKGLSPSEVNALRLRFGYRIHLS